MKKILFGRCSLFAFLLLFTVMPAAWAQYWVDFDEYTRYMAIGDSLTSGYAAHPATQGFAYRIYQEGVIDGVNHTLFCNIGVPGATSQDVLSFQVPQVKLFFKPTGKIYRQVITLTVGGNDMLQLLDPNVDPFQVLQKYGNNLAGILTKLRSDFPNAEIYVGNLYDPQLGIPNESLLIGALNQVVSGIIGMFPEKVTLVDIFSAFQGKSGLLLGERQGSGMQIHPTNAGYKVMTDAFAGAIQSK